MAAASGAARGQADYGDQGYWEERYRVSERSRYDWYLPYSEMRAELLAELAAVAGQAVLDDSRREARAACKVLVVGCGNSKLSEDMHADGFADMLSVDYSTVVVERMRAEQPDLRFEVMDATKMACATGEYDLVVDKGTLDAILCGAGSAEKSARMLAECQRVLRPGGLCVIVTYGPPTSRMRYLQSQRLKWSVRHQMVGGVRHMYSMVKKDKP